MTKVPVVPLLLSALMRTGPADLDELTDELREIGEDPDPRLVEEALGLMKSQGLVEHAEGTSLGSVWLIKPPGISALEEEEGGEGKYHTALMLN